ncbi:MAG: hypothetical protein RR612_03350, partial [Oscillospiraceae bacterium]
DRQHGLPQLKIADLAADSRVLSAAQHEAAAILAQDAALEHNKPLKNEVERLFSRQTSTN